MTLTKHQKEVFDGIRAHIEQDYRTICLLEGYAGTGKSFLLSHLVKHYYKRGFNVVVTGLTHKASLVLYQMLDKVGGFRVSDHFSTEQGSHVTVSTLHKALKLRPVRQEDGSYVLGRVHEKKRFFPKKTIMIIDEVSMMSQVLKDFVDEDLCYMPVILSGDRAQVLPVGEPISPAFAVRPRFQLSEILRQGKDSPVMMASHQVRLAQSDSGLPWPVLEQKNDGKKGVFRYSKSKDEAIREAFLSEEFRKNPDAVRYVAWTNRRVQQINRKVQKWLFFERYGKIREPFYPGEIVILRNRYIEPVKDGVEAQNGQEFQVDHIEEDLVSFDWHRYGVQREPGIPVWKIWMTNKVAICMAQDQRLYKEAEQLLWSRLCQMPPKRKSGFLEFIETFSASFGILVASYAMTVHTAQGSTFDGVFVDMSDLHAAFKRAPLEGLQLLYVALTRARFAAYLIES